MKNYVLVLAFWCSWLVSYGQEKADSLRRLLPHTQGPARLATLCALSEAMYLKNIDSSLYYAEQAFGIARREGNQTVMLQAQGHTCKAYLVQQRARRALKITASALQTLAQFPQEPDSLRAIFYRLTGEAYFLTGQLDTAIHYLTKSLEIAQALKSDHNRAASLMGLADVYHQRNDYYTALNYLLQAVQLKKKGHLPDSANLEEAYLQLGNLNINTREYATALNYFRQALQLGKKHHNKLNTSAVLNGIGGVYLSLKDYSRALAYMQCSLAAAQELTTYEIGSVWNNLGLAYIGLKRHQQALKVLKRAYDLASQNQHKFGQYVALLNIGVVLQQLGQFEQARNHYRNVIVMGKELGNAELVSATYQQLANLYEQKHQPVLALRYYKLHVQLDDSLFTFNKARSAQILLTQYGAQERENHLRALKHEKLVQSVQMERTEQQNKRLLEGIVVLVATVLLIIVFYLQIKKDKRLLTHQRTTIQQQYDELTRVHSRLEESEQALTRSLATKDRFFSILAHDLRGPLVTLQTLIGVFHQRLLQGATTDLRQYLHQLEADCSTVLNLLNNLLYWSLTQQHALSFRPRPVNVRQVVEESIRLLKPTAYLKNIILAWEPVGEPMSYTDPHMVQFIVRNLLSNAIKFTPNGGTVTVRIHPGVQTCLLQVTDHGKGMEPIVLEKLLRKQTLHVEMDSQWEKGTGLGLQLCCEFATLMRAKLWAESRPGKGSTFYLAIPNHLPKAGPALPDVASLGQVADQLEP